MSQEPPTPTPELLAIGARIRERREQLRLSQSALAGRMGIASPMVVSRYENGLREMRISTAQALAEALEMSVGELLDGQPERSLDRTGGPMLVAEAEGPEYAAGGALQAALERIQAADPEAFAAVFQLVRRLDPGTERP